MKLNKTKPYEVLKDPDKAAAERRAKRKSIGEALVFFLLMGFSLWWIESPDTLKHTFQLVRGWLK